MLIQKIDQWDDTYPDRDTLAHDASSEKALVAVDGNQVIGMLALNEHQDIEYGDVPWEFDHGRVAVVHRLYQGLGYRRAGQVRFRKGLFDCFEKQMAAPANPTWKSDKAVGVTLNLDQPLVGE